jgi:DNA-binding response OmpR family regulator
MYLQEKHLKILIVGIDSGNIKNDYFNFTDACRFEWKVSTIESGKKCLELISYGDYFDMIIIGRLSDISDFDLISQIRDDSDIPIIFLTHDNDMSKFVNAFDSGADDYIIQPINKAVFIARLKALVRRKTWDVQMIEQKFNRRFVRQVEC